MVARDGLREVVFFVLRCKSLQRFCRVAPQRPSEVSRRRLKFACLDATNLPSRTLSNTTAPRTTAAAGHEDYVNHLVWRVLWLDLMCSVDDDDDDDDAAVRTVRTAHNTDYSLSGRSICWFPAYMYSHTRDIDSQ